MRIDKKKALTLFALILLVMPLLLVNMSVPVQATIPMYWKPSYPNYAPSGMPDFDEKQDAWTGPGGLWSHCAPVAVANSLWWLDSEFDPSNLVTKYPGALGEHDPSNVPFLVNNLAALMQTNVFGFGTRTIDIGPGIRAYLAQQGVSNKFTVTTVMAPNFTYVDGQVEKCEDVVLCLGLWINTTQGWYRETYPYPAGVGHCVTVAGINSTSPIKFIGISDPWNDTAVYGGPGVVLPPTHPIPPPPYPFTLHNDASFVSHDIYPVLILPAGSPGKWAIRGYGYPYSGPPPYPANVYVIVEAAVITSPTPQLHWKASYPNYAPSGMPDFSEKQDNWNATGTWSWCAPVAVANSLWWLDSEFDPSNLVTRYPGALGEHDPSNVQPLVTDLAGLMGTDVGGSGTKIANIGPGIVAYLGVHGVSSQFTVTTVMIPNFTYVESEVEKCEDVVLCLGLYINTTQGWYREGPAGVAGHCVTVAGINSTSLQIGISDPWNDTAEYGGPGVVLPPTPTHPPAGHASTVHNNASFVSHDIYPVLILPAGSPGKWALTGFGYPYWPPPYPANVYVIVEAAVITSQAPPVCGVHITNVATFHWGLPESQGYPGWTVQVNVTVYNNGTMPLNCTVKAYYYNATTTVLIGTQNIINLAPTNTITLMFNWVLPSPPCKTYTVKANATSACGASDQFIDGSMKVKFPGDVNNSNKVTWEDLSALGAAYGSKNGPPRSPNWNPQCDFNDSGTVTWEDLSVIGANYGKGC